MYDIKFKLDVQGGEALAQIPALVDKLSSSTKVSAKTLGQYQSALEMCINANVSFGASISVLAAKADNGADALSRVGKQAAAIVAAEQDAARASDALAGANDKTAAAANNAAAATQKLTAAQKDQVASARATARDYVANPFGAGILPPGEAGPVGRFAVADETILAGAYAENARRTQSAGRLQEIAAADNARRSSSAQNTQQRAGQLQARAEAENIKRDAAALKEAEQEANKTASAFLRLGSATGIVDGKTGSLVRSAGALGGGLGSLVNPATIASAAIIGIGIAAAKASYDLVAEFSAAERETQNLADRLGLTLQESEKLSAAARLSGVSVGSLEGASRSLAEALENPTTSGKKAADALHKLGIETIGLQGPLEDVGPILTQLLEKLAKIPEQAKRFALAQEALPRGVSNAIKPLIADYDELQKTVERLHVGEDAAGSKELLDADRQIKELDEAWMLFKKHLAVAIDPIIIPVIRGISGLLENSDPSSAVAANGPLELNEKGARLDALKGSFAADRGLLAGRAGLTTSGAAFRAIDDQTRESLEQQLSEAKAAANKLRPSLRGDQLGSQKRDEDLAEYNKQESAVKRLESAIERLNKAKHLPDERASEAARLREEAEKDEAKELTGHEKINQEIDARIAKLKEEQKIKYGTAELTKDEVTQLERIRTAEHARLDQQEAITTAQNRREVLNTAIEQTRRLDKAKAAGSAEIALAQGRNEGDDESGIQAAFEARISEANKVFQDAAAQVHELRKQRDENQQIRPDKQKLDTDDKAIDIAERKAAGDAVLSLYEAQKRQELQLDALKKKRFDDEFSHLKDLRTITDANTKADVEDRKAVLSRQEKLLGAQDDGGSGGELDLLRRQLDLRRQAAQIDRDERQRTIDAERKDQENLLDAHPEQRKEIEQELAKLRADEIANQRGFERELGDERIDIELRVAEIRKRGEEEYKQFVVGLVNSGLTGGHATVDYLRQFGQKVFGQIVSNVAGLTFDSFKKLTPSIPGQSDADGKPTLLGKVLAWTPLGSQDGAAKRAAADLAKVQSSAKEAEQIARGNRLGHTINAKDAAEQQNQDKQARRDLIRSQDEERKSVDANTEALNRNTRAHDTQAHPGDEEGSELIPEAGHGVALDANTASNQALNETLTRMHRDASTSANDENDPSTHLGRSIERLNRTLTYKPATPPDGDKSASKPTTPSIPETHHQSQFGIPAATSNTADRSEIVTALSANTAATDRNTAAMIASTNALLAARALAASTSGGGGGLVVTSPAVQQVIRTVGAAPTRAASSVISMIGSDRSAWGGGVPSAQGSALAASIPSIITSSTNVLNRVQSSLPSVSGGGGDDTTAIVAPRSFGASSTWTEHPSILLNRSTYGSTVSSAGPTSSSANELDSSVGSMAAVESSLGKGGSSGPLGSGFMTTVGTLLAPGIVAGTGAASSQAQPAGTSVPVIAPEAAGALDALSRIINTSLAPIGRPAPPPVQDTAPPPGVRYDTAPLTAGSNLDAESPGQQGIVSYPVPDLGVNLPSSGFDGTMRRLPDGLIDRTNTPYTPPPVPASPRLSSAGQGSTGIVSPDSSTGILGALQKAQQVLGIAGGASASTGKYSQSGGGGTSASTSGLSGVLSGASQHTGDLAGIFTGVGSNPGGGSQSLSTPERIGGAIGTAGVVTGGTIAAIKGFEQGGAKGDLAGIGSILGTAAVLDPEPISKAALMVGAAVSGIVSALLPDPRAEREKKIKKEIASSQYLAPEAFNITQDMHGNFTDTDATGTVRDSSFRSTPQVQEPYLYFHGSTYVAPVPGNITAPFSTNSAAPLPQTVQNTTQNVFNAPVFNGQNFTGQVNAVDSQSFADAAMKNQDAIGNAAAAHLKNSDTALAQQVRYLTSN